MDSRVVDSRPAEEGEVIRRRRECERCGRRFTTYEKVEMTPMLVVKKDGRREPFDPEKIRQGVVKSCEKRPVSALEIDGIVAGVESQALSQLDREIPTKEIGELVMERLRGIDEVAYIRFACVYRNFEDIRSFMDVLSHLLDSRAPSPETNGG
jgi:transcriptional repressor NrdR